MPADIPEVNVTAAGKLLVPALLQQARQAYWARDYVTAEMHYHQITKMATDNVDAWGELGNIYYLQAKWPQAAEAYTEAALRLLKTGDYPRAMFMRYIVRGLDARQAARIDEQLRHMQAPAKG